MSNAIEYTFDYPPEQVAGAIKNTVRSIFGLKSQKDWTQLPRTFTIPSIMAYLVLDRGVGGTTVTGTCLEEHQDALDGFFKMATRRLDGQRAADEFIASRKEEDWV